MDGCIYIQVDLSTMLEEAVNYVKLLQLQIKVYIIGDMDSIKFKTISFTYKGVEEKLITLV